MTDCLSFKSQSNSDSIKKGGLIMNNETIVDIIEDLAKVWNELKPNTQRFLSILFAGERKGKDVIFNNIIGQMFTKD